MKLFNYYVENSISLGAMLNGRPVDLTATAKQLGVELEGHCILDLLATWPKSFNSVKEIIDNSVHQDIFVHIAESATEPIQYAAPVRRPGTFRDFYAFETHVRNARKLRGLGVAPEWYEFPVFYFSNPNSIRTSGDTVRFPAASKQCDYELEVGAFLGGSGKDLSPDAAEKLIAGYVVLNDWSARDIQRREMAVGLGPAKGKDFATSIGPLLVTPDELEDKRSGKGFDLKMTASINGNVTSEGNWSTIHYSLAEMIARASADAEVYPGELFGSGTVGNGCLLERGLDHNLWLKSGDVIELEIERLGKLVNTIN